MKFKVKLYKSKIDMIDYIDIEFKNDLLSTLRTEFQLKQEEEEALIKRLEEEAKKGVTTSKSWKQERSKNHEARCKKLVNFNIIVNLIQMVKN